MSHAESAAPAARSSRGRWRTVWLVAGATITAAALIIGSVGVASVWAAVQRTEQTRHESQQYLRPVSQIDVHATLGKVSLIGSDPGRVDVQRTLKWSGAEPQVAETWQGDTLSVSAGCPDAFPPWLSQLCSVDYAAEVPRDTAVDVETTVAPVHVRELDGALVLRSTVAEILLEDVAGPLSAHTTTGDITGSKLRSAQVEAEVSTGTADLQFAEPPDRVTVVASTGNVTVEVPRHTGPYRVDAQTMGEQQVDIMQDPAAERIIDIRAETGDVHVRYAS